jgi:DnaD/phage-associated family protein
MAKYRQLYTEFWSDSFVLELTPEEKYFYLYLISNSKTTQCGIYEISKRTIETDTGYNRETVEKLIQRFCDYKKILYCDDTKELMVINWIKYNVPNNLNAIKCVNKEISKIKHKEFVEILFNKCQAAKLDIERIFGNIVIKDEEEINELSEFQINNPKSRGFKGPYKPLPSNKEEVTNKKQEVISKKEEEVVRDKNNAAAGTEGLETIIKIFEENVHAITPFEFEKILEFTKLVSSDVIIMAIEEAVIYNAKTMKYIDKILSSWISKGVKTAEGVKEYQKKWTNKNSNSIRQNVKKGTFCDYEQRTYDFDELEKRLLGFSDTEDLEE